jgi:hypothetical protein
MPGLTGLQAAAAQTDWTLSTQDTEIKIGIRNGTEAILELHTMGRPWEWVQTPIEQSLPAAVTQDGAVRQLRWSYAGANQDRERRTLALTFKNATPALTIGAQSSLGLKSLALLTQSKNMTDGQKQVIRRASDIYKSWIRPVLQDAKFSSELVYVEEAT